MAKLQEQSLSINRAYIVNHVRFLGQQVDMPTIYHFMDIFHMTIESGGKSLSMNQYLGSEDSFHNTAIQGVNGVRGSTIED